jgi:prepilin peptidase CpaA
LATLLPDILCIVVLLIATVIDLRTRRIPNTLTLAGIGVGLGLNFALVALESGMTVGLKQGLLPSVTGALFLFVCFLGLAAIRAVGMGDVKLMAAVGAFVRWPLALWVLVYVLLAGGGLSLIYAIKNRQLGAVVSNMVEGIGSAVKRKPPKEISLHYVPYALGILIGTVWTILLRYIPELRFPQ